MSQCSIRRFTLALAPLFVLACGTDMSRPEEAEAPLSSYGGTLPYSLLPHEAVSLLDGRILIVGGAQLPSTDSYQLFNPRSETHSAGSFGVGWSYQGVTRLDDGRVLVTGGHKCLRGSECPPTAEVKMFDPATNQWTDVAPMNVSRAQHSATLLASGKVLVVGGQTRVEGSSPPTRETSSAEVYDPRTGAWTNVAPLSRPLPLHVAVRLRDGRVLVADEWYGTPVSEIFDERSNTWQRVPMAARPYAHTLTVLGNGSVLAAGGTYQLFNPRTNTWTVTSAPAHPRHGHAAAALPDGSAIIVGGHGDAERTIIASAERFDPVSLQWTAAAPLLDPAAYLSLTPISGSLFYAASGLHEEFYEPSLSCRPVRCASAQVACGELSDGCGNSLYCGPCGPAHALTISRVFASSTQAGHLASHAVDGVETTSWYGLAPESAPSPSPSASPSPSPVPWSWTAVLDGSRRIDTVTMRWEGARTPLRYEIQTSTDGRVYTAVVRNLFVQPGVGIAPATVRLYGARATHVRVQIQEVSNSFPGLVEFNVSGE